MLTARAKQILKLVLFGMGIVLLAVAWIVFSSWRKRQQGAPAPDVVTTAISELSAKVVEANHQAAVEIAVARTKDASVKAELTSILADEEGSRRRSRLVSLRKRMDVQ